MNLNMYAPRMAATSFSSVFITMFLVFHLLILLRIHCDSSHDDVICSFAKQNCNLIVNRRKLYRVSAVPKRPISVWQKHGEICLYLPTSPKDITIAMDVEIQPEPCAELQDTKNLIAETCLPAGNRDSSCLNFPAKNNINYSRQQLFNYRLRFPVSQKLHMSLKHLGILKTRRVRAGRSTKRRSGRIPELLGTRRISISTRSKFAYYSGKREDLKQTVNKSNLIYIKANSSLSRNLIESFNRCDKRCSFGLLNCRSVCNKTHAIKDYVVENDFDILAVTETWLRSDPNLNVGTIGDLTPKGYSFHHTARIENRGGGVGLLYKNSLKIRAEPVEYFSQFKSFEVTGMQIRMQSGMAVLLVVYRPPTSAANHASLEHFMDEFGLLLEIYSTKPGSLIIAGDFNFHVDNKGDGPSKNFMNILESFNLCQHVNEKTHRAGHILDLVITRNDENIVQSVTVQDSCISDHYTVMCELRFKKPRFERKTITFRKLKSVDINSFSEDIEHSRLFLESPNDLTREVELYNSELLNILDNHAPLATQQVTIRPAAPWYTDEIKCEKRIRRRLERRWRVTRQSSDRLNFTRQCHRVSELLSSSRSQYYSELVKENKHDQRKLFGTVYKLLHLDPDPKYPPHQTSEELANNFLTFFNHKIANIRYKLDQRGLPADEFFSDVPLLEFKLSQFKCITLDELYSIIRPLAKKSCFLDPIPTRLLLQSLDTLSSVILKIVNLSIESAFLPVSLKEAIIKPILKKSNLDPLEYMNFRPISNLPFLSKVIEKVIAAQLTSYVEDNNLCELFQSAYRRNHSTETALIRVHNDIAMAIDKGHSVILVLLDLSAAFDTVDHCKLLLRLNTRFGICDKALEWFRSYLSGRTQFVKVNNGISFSHSISQGVPQGSVLGPILYSLYTSPLGGHSEGTWTKHPLLCR